MARIRDFSGHRLAIVAHYDRTGGVDPAFAQLCLSLNDLDYRVMVATTAPAPLDAFAQRVEDFAFCVVSRGNEGFDFQSWRRGIEVARTDALDFDRIVLTNGSMYGPTGPLDAVLASMDGSGSWGMTESMDFRRHVQSWWLGFGDRVLDHPEFDRYWARVRPATNKWGTILSHELTWAGDLALAGPTRAFVTVEQHGCDRNPLFFAWRELIRDWQMPFVKRSLFDQNYDRIDMTGWQDFLTQHAPGFDQSVIAQS